MKKIGLFFVLLLCVSVALANKTSVKVEAPEKVQKGKAVTLVIKVSHKGNSKMHHTDWVKLDINGKEVKKWEYNGSNLPPDGEFTVEYTLTPTANFEVTAQGNCNLHGSTGTTVVQVKVE